MTNIYILIDLITPKESFHFVNDYNERMFNGKVYKSAEFEIKFEREMIENDFMFGTIRRPIISRLTGELVLIQKSMIFTPEKYYDNFQCYIYYVETQDKILSQETYDTYLENSTTANDIVRYTFKLVQTDKRILPDIYEDIRDNGKKVEDIPEVVIASTPLGGNYWYDIWAAYNADKKPTSKKKVKIKPMSIEPVRRKFKL